MTVLGRAAGALATAAIAIATARPVAAHVDYVTDPVARSRSALSFVVETLSVPANAALLGGGAIAGLFVVAGYLLVRPSVSDLRVLRDRLVSYDDLVPWMLRLSLGLPLVGAGFQGYLFAPTITFQPGRNPFLRLLLIGLGFLLLFGLATRLVATVGLLVYGGVLAVEPGVVIAFEYVPGFVAIALLGGGRPSADDMLEAVSGTPETLYGRLDPVYGFQSRLDRATAPYRRYVPTVLRVGVGATFVYLGAVEKLGDPDRTLAVVSQYDLTAVVPVAPELWVLGAALVEIAVGLALVAGFLTRAGAATAFLMFTLTLFGLPNDPVLAHVTLFGLVSAIFTLGPGPLSIDARLDPRTDPERSAVVAT